MHHSRIWRLKRNFIGNLRKNYPSLVGTGTVCNLKCFPLKGYITVCFFLAALWNCESRAWTWQILQRKNRCILQGFLYLFRWSRGSTHKMPAPPPWYPKYRYQIYRPSPVYCCILSAFCATKIQVFWKNVHTDVIRFGQLRVELTSQEWRHLSLWAARQCRQSVWRPRRSWYRGTGAGSESYRVSAGS